MKYAALFRGINVGGKNIVKMADLKQLLTDLGLCEVETYIQSGNAVFETPLDELTLLAEIKGGFVDRFRFASNTVVRSQDEIRELIEQLPFTGAEITEAEAVNSQVEHLYVYFLDNPPEQALIDKIRPEDIGADKLRIGKREVYLLCRQSIRNSKVAACISKIFDSATVRNWRTVNKLYDMMV